MLWEIYGKYTRKGIEISYRLCYNEGNFARVKIVRIFTKYLGHVFLSAPQPMRRREHPNA